MESSDDDLNDDFGDEAFDFEDDNDLEDSGNDYDLEDDDNGDDFDEVVSTLDLCRSRNVTSFQFLFKLMKRGFEYIIKILFLACSYSQVVGTYNNYGSSLRCMSYFSCISSWHTEVYEK